jgi:hypothetical protein
VFSGAPKHSGLLTYDYDYDYRLSDEDCLLLELVTGLALFPDKAKRMACKLNLI